MARVKRVEDIDYVREQILATVKQFRETPVDAAKLDQVRKRLRYESALRMDNSDAIAGVLAQYRGPETHARNHERPLRSIRETHAGRHPAGRDQVPGRERPDHRHAHRSGRRQVKRACPAHPRAGCALAPLQAQMRAITLPSKSPLVNFRIVFTTGAASDPGDKPGLA